MATRKVSIYIVTNTLNGKAYIGITLNIKKRWSSHRSARSKKSLLHVAIRKYGKENFLFEHFADAFDWKSACDIEKMLIIDRQTKAPHGYNITDGGDGTAGVPSHNKGKSWSEEAKAKMSAVKFGKKSTDEARKNQSLALKGLKKSEEHKKKIGSSQKGIPCPQRGRKGKKLSEETKQKISATRIAKFAMKKAALQQSEVEHGY